MARIDKRRTAGSQTNAQRVTSTPRRGSTSGAIEDTMFFPRLRRHAKWMFVFLAVVFGLGFTLFGIGAGGTGLGDLFKGSSGGSGGANVQKALEATEKRPRDAAAWLALADAYRTQNDTDSALAAQLRYTRLAPKNAEGGRTPSPCGR